MKKPKRNKALPIPRMPKGSEPGTFRTLRKPKDAHVPKPKKETIPVPKIGRKLKKI